MGLTRIGIVGYGNLGRGVEIATAKHKDLELVAVFTRRDPATVVTEGAKVLPLDDLIGMAEGIDVLILCGGSRSDLPEQSPELAKHFNLVDSFDTHAKIPAHFASVDATATAANKTAIISAGWDPGMFSLNRMMGEAILPEGETYTFWGRGLSQGHSDAVRRVPGVKSAVQYTIPSETAIASVRAGEMPALSTKDKHVRECFVVLEKGADAENVKHEIVTMPDYFEPFDTTVNFITAEELERDHAGMPHGGFVIRSGKTSPDTVQTIEYRLSLDSNPEFTASVLVAYARAAHRMAQKGDFGAKTVYDVAPGLLSPRTPEQLRAELL